MQTIWFHEFQPKGQSQGAKGVLQYATMPDFKLKSLDPLNYWLHVRSNQSSLEIFLLSSLRAAVHCTLGELSINYADLGWMMANASITICNMKIFPFHTWALIYIFLKHRNQKKDKGRAKITAFKTDCYLLMC